MEKYITGLYLPTYDTKQEATERAIAISAEYGEDVGIFKLCDTILVVEEEA